MGPFSGTLIAKQLKGPENGPILGPESDTQNGSVFRTRNIEKCIPAVPFSEHANQSWSRPLTSPKPRNDYQGKIKSRDYPGATPRAGTSLAIYCPPSSLLQSIAMRSAQGRSPLVADHHHPATCDSFVKPMSCDHRPAVHIRNSAVTAPFPRKLVS